MHVSVYPCLVCLLRVCVCVRRLSGTVCRPLSQRCVCPCTSSTPVSEWCRVYPARSIRTYRLYLHVVVCGCDCVRFLASMLPCHWRSPSSLRYAATCHSLTHSMLWVVVVVARYPSRSPSTLHASHSRPEYVYSVDRQLLLLPPSMRATYHCSASRWRAEGVILFRRHVQAQSRPIQRVHPRRTVPLIQCSIRDLLFSIPHSPAYVTLQPRPATGVSVHIDALAHRMGARAHTHTHTHSTFHPHRHVPPRHTPHHPRPVIRTDLLTLVLVSSGPFRDFTIGHDGRPFRVQPCLSTATLVIAMAITQFPRSIDRPHHPCLRARWGSITYSCRRMRAHRLHKPGLIQEKLLESWGSRPVGVPSAGGIRCLDGGHHQTGAGPVK